MSERSNEHWFIGGDANGALGALDEVTLMRPQAFMRSQHMGERGAAVVGTEDNRDPRGAMLVGWVNACELAPVSLVAGSHTHCHYSSHVRTMRDYAFLKAASGTPGVTFGLEDVPSARGVQGKWVRSHPGRHCYDAPTAGKE